MDSPRNSGGGHGSSSQMVEVDALPLLSGQPTQIAISEDNKKKLVEENVSPRELSPPVPPAQVIAAMMADKATKTDDGIKQRIKGEMNGGGGITAEETKLDDDTQHAPSPAVIRPPAPPLLVAALYEMMRTSTANELNDNEIKANAKKVISSSSSTTSPPLHSCKPPTPPSYVAAAYEMMDTSNRGVTDDQIKTNAKKTSVNSSPTSAYGKKDSNIQQRIKREMEGADEKEPAANPHEETNNSNDEKDGCAQQHHPSIPPMALPTESRATPCPDMSAIVTRPPPRSMLPKEDTDIELGTEESAPVFYALEATAVLDDTVYSATPIIDLVYTDDDDTLPPLPWWKKHRFCLSGGMGLLVGVAVAVVVALLIGTGGDTTTDANGQASVIGLEPPSLNQTTDVVITVESSGKITDDNDQVSVGSEAPSVSPSQLLPTTVGITVPLVNEATTNVAATTTTTTTSAITTEATTTTTTSAITTVEVHEQEAHVIPTIFASASGNTDEWFCGTSWPDANSNCHAHCPSGDDVECVTSMGEEYGCFYFTGCDPNADLVDDGNGNNGNGGNGNSNNNEDTDTDMSISTPTNVGAPSSHGKESAKASAAPAQTSYTPSHGKGNND